MALELYPSLAARANKISMWGDWSTDIPEYYRSIINGVPNKYGPADIEYKYNDFGFRCDNFNLQSELPVLFVGCSMSEGIGIRQEETWGYKLLTKIRNKTDKNIPYWNIALSGRGIDTTADCLYWFANNIAKPKFIFGRLPPFSRREYILESDKNQLLTWAPWNLNDTLNNVFSDECFKNHQARRSLMLMDSVREICDAKMFCSFWSHDTVDENILKEFPNIGNLDSYFTVTDLGRDNIHIGPETHTGISEHMWVASEQYF